MSALDTRSHEIALANRVDKTTTSTLAISDAAGGIRFQNMSEVLEVAKLMALGGVSVPKHLRGQPGACLAVALQAIEWRISPISLANKSYSVNDRLAYEASVFNAIVQSRAPIKGRIKSKYAGVGDTRTCTVYAETNDSQSELVEYTSPPFGKIQPKNSPLWRNDPDQQLYYFSVRSFCRRHFPDILLGIYSDDEILDASPMMASGNGGSSHASPAPENYDILDGPASTTKDDPLAEAIEGREPEPNSDDGPTDAQLAEDEAKRQERAKSGIVEPMFPGAENQPRR